METRPLDIAITWVQNFSDFEIDDEIATEFQSLAQAVQDLGFPVIKRDFDPCAGTGVGFRKTYRDFNGDAYLEALPPKVRDNFFAGGETKCSIAKALNRFLGMTAREVGANILVA